MRRCIKNLIAIVSCLAAAESQTPSNAFARDKDEADKSDVPFRRGGPRESAAKLGATAATETAVAKALAWLAAHQRRDGSWSVDHRDGECGGRCKNHGDLKDTDSAATGLALLPLLAAGNTPSRGQYKNVVRTGVEYLVDHMDARTGAINEKGGKMYSHGIAALALCEAYAATKDKKLRPAAQLAIDFIHSAQHRRGGWRYLPRQPGDTSVTGWQLAALFRAKSTGLKVDDAVLKKASAFLDSVQSDEGTYYGYVSPGKSAACSAIGLGNRMHLGWKRDRPALKKGMDYLNSLGPSKVNVYYDYYATKALFDYGGAEWKKWNEAMREQLITTQEQDGHAKGSWFFPGGYTRAAGRHYCTCLAATILTVYYREPLFSAEDANKP